MEVVLLKDVKRLGQVGDIADVAPGYARNYLIPQRLAALATPEMRQQAAQRKAKRQREERNERERAEDLAADIEGLELVFKAKAGESDRLYGSITNADIAERLEEVLGEPVDKRKVILEEPIKELGRSEVDVRLHTDVSAMVTVIVEAEEE